MTACWPETVDEAVASAILEVLPERLVVERLTRTPDSSGGSTEAYAPVLTDVPCRVDPVGLQSGEAIQADRLGLIEPYTISVPAATDIRVPDELVTLGARFHVQAAPPYHTGALLARVLATVVS